MFMHIIQRLKKYFIPIRSNGYRPILLRTESILRIVALIVSIEIIFLAHTFVVLRNTDFLAAILPDTLTELANQNRQAYDISVLEYDAVLARAAQLKAEDMATNGYFSHISPAGITPWYWFRKIGYEYNYAGENLAVNFVDSDDINKAWMKSTSHRANILNAYFTRVGIGISKGIYKGKESVFVVEFFAQPYKKQSPNIERSFNQNAGSRAAYLQVSDRSNSEISAKRYIAEPTGTPIPAEVLSAVDFRGAPIDILPPRLPENGPFKPRSMGQFLSVPHLVTDYLFFIVLLVVSVALLSSIFVKKRIRRPVLIANGLLMFFFVIATVLLNTYISTTYGLIE